MRPRDKAEADKIDQILTKFHKETRPLPGIQAPARRTTFLEQLFESIHRVRYIARLLERDISDERANPQSELFDPIKAAVLRMRQGEHDEACWFVFLFVHFGKHLRSGCRLTRDIYGSLGNGPHWDWARVSANPMAFPTWLTTNQNQLENDGIRRHFGNHRKYVSLDPISSSGTGQAFVTYVNWVMPHQSHIGLFDSAANVVGHTPRPLFQELYNSMVKSVASFGRTGVFDYLTMIGKLNLASIEPGSTYMTGSTGPLKGARLLFGDLAKKNTPREIDNWLVELEAVLDLEMGMQVLEDSLCNWQKSPDRFRSFRG